MKKFEELIKGDYVYQIQINQHSLKIKKLVVKEIKFTKYMKVDIYFEKYLGWITVDKNSSKREYNNFDDNMFATTLEEVKKMRTDFIYSQINKCETEKTLWLHELTKSID